MATVEYAKWVVCESCGTLRPPSAMNTTVCADDKWCNSHETCAPEWRAPIAIPAEGSGENPIVAVLKSKPKLTTLEKKKKLR